MALRLNTSEKNEIMPRRKARAEKPRLAQMLLRSGSLAGVESENRSTDYRPLPGSGGGAGFAFAFGPLRFGYGCGPRKWKLKLKFLAEKKVYMWGFWDFGLGK